MSDFLTRLVERELGIGASVAPLVASIHAASPSRTEAKGTVRLAVTDGVAPRSVSDRPVASPSSLAPEPPEPGRGDEHGSRLIASTVPTIDDDASVGTGHGTIDAGVAEPRGEGLEPRGATPVCPVAERESSPPPMPEPTLLVPQPRRAASDETPIEPRYGPAMPSPAGEPEAPPVREMRRATPVNPVADGESSPRPTPESTLLVPQPRRASSDDTPIEPWHVPPMSAPEREPDTRPTVRVTIGRVEVRAVMPPQPMPAKRPPPTSRLSLGDYLKQRNRGGS